MATVGAGDRDPEGLGTAKGAEGERLGRGVKPLSRNSAPGAGTDGVRDRNGPLPVVVTVARARQGGLFDYTRRSSLSWNCIYYNACV